MTRVVLLEEIMEKCLLKGIIMAEMFCSGIRSDTES